LNKLDCTINKSCRSTLGFLVHNCNLSVGGEVSHDNSGVHRVVVRRDILFCITSIELWSLILNSCLHFKTVGVSVEHTLTLSIFVCEVLSIFFFEELPVDGNIFSLVVSHDWDTIKFKIELDESFLVRRNGSSENCFVRVCVIVSSRGIKNKFLYSQDFAFEIIISC